MVLKTVFIGYYQVFQSMIKNIKSDPDNDNILVLTVSEMANNQDMCRFYVKPLDDSSFTTLYWCGIGPGVHEPGLDAPFAVDNRCFKFDDLISIRALPRT
jgi:hypothetical protein